MIILQIDSEQLTSLMKDAVRQVIGENPVTNPQPAKEELLTVQDAANFLSLSVPTIYTLISKGEIPVMKRSKRCYFSRAELINYLKAGREKMVIVDNKETDTGTQKKDSTENYLKKLSKNK